MFCNTKNFNQPLQDWDMSSVKWTWEMFAGAVSFNQPLDKWNVSNVEKMQSMFNRAESFNQDLSAWGNKLGKAQDMKRMFANTKSLNQTFAWKLNENCDLTNITKGSALKLEISFVGDDNSQQETLQDSAQSSEQITPTQNKKFARSVSSFRIYKIAMIPNNLNKLKETNKKDCLYRWIPKNIKANYEIFFAKSDENQIISATEADWEFICYRVFGHCFAVETDDFKLPQTIIKRDMLTIEQRKDDEEFDDFNFDEHQKDYKNDDIEIILEDKEHIMRIYNGDTTEINSYRILNIIGALILAKDYEAKMEYFNEQARAKDTKLTECHKKICDFDLQHYQNVPVIADLSVIYFWNKLSQRYMIEAKHKELQETISRVAQLVSEENQKKINYIMLAVAIFSALGAILVAVPVAQSLLN